MRIGAVLVSINPEEALAFVFDIDGRCVAVPHGTTDSYLGQDMSYVRCAMASIMRYENGTEPQPNKGRSANGYPYIIEIPSPF